jgi:hypothetical protein
VLLMRTAYEVVDELDIIAMDQFQKLFFERRQTEWEHYLGDNANAVKQGVLTDARYFDFITFAQFLVSPSVILRLSWRCALCASLTCKYSL